MAAAQCACTQEFFEQVYALFVLAFWLGLFVVLVVLGFRDLFWRYFNQPIPFRPDSVFADRTPKVERQFDEHIIKLLSSRIPHFDLWTLIIEILEIIDSLTEKCWKLEFDFLGPCEVLPLPKKTRELGSVFRRLYTVDDCETRAG